MLPLVISVVALVLAIYSMVASPTNKRSPGSWALLLVTLWVTLASLVSEGYFTDLP